MTPKRMQELAQAIADLCDQDAQGKRNMTSKVCGTCSAPQLIDMGFTWAEIDHVPEVMPTARRLQKHNDFRDEEAGLDRPAAE